jgi:hypothetical protein
MPAQSSNQTNILLARHVTTRHATAVAPHQPPDRHVTRRVSRVLSLVSCDGVQDIFTLLLELYVVQADKEFSRALAITAAWSGGPVPLQRRTSNPAIQMEEWGGVQ